MTDKQPSQRDPLLFLVWLVVTLATITLVIYETTYPRIPIIPPERHDGHDYFVYYDRGINKFVFYHRPGCPRCPPPSKVEGLP